MRVQENNFFIIWSLRDYFFFFIYMGVYGISLLCRLFIWAFLSVCSRRDFSFIYMGYTRFPFYLNGVLEDLIFISIGLNEISCLFTWGSTRFYFSYFGTRRNYIFIYKVPRICHFYLLGRYTRFHFNLCGQKISNSYL